jgi:MFS family permease
MHAWMDDRYGLLIGPLNAFTRSTYARLVPRGREASFFSLYQITDKGSAWIGPLLLVLVQQATGSYRWAMSVIAIFFVVALLLLFRVDDERGRIDARRMTRAGGGEGGGGVDDSGSADIEDDLEHESIAMHHHTNHSVPTTIR